MTEQPAGADTAPGADSAPGADTASESSRNVVLTGFMGTGKTTVGRILARRLGWDFADTDKMIESRHGPIPDLVATGDWSHFRGLERQIAQELSSRRNMVISTGGRLMLDSQCAALLEPVSHVVWLKATPATIVARVVDAPGADPSKRPLLTQDGADPAESVNRLLRLRQNQYARYPSVDTDNLSPDQVATQVLELLQL